MPLAVFKVVVSQLMLLQLLLAHSYEPQACFTFHRSSQSTLFAAERKCIDSQCPNLITIKNTISKRTKCCCNMNKGVIASSGESLSDDYVESPSDRDVRLLFEASPFQTAEYVVDGIIGAFLPKKIPEPPLRRVNLAADIKEMNRMDENSSELFAPLYGRKLLNRTHNEESDVIIRRSTKQARAAEFQRKAKGMQNFKIKIAYKGTDFCGWQIQPRNSKRSVQQSLMDILEPLLKRPASVETKAHKEKPNKPLNIRVCGRTDAGVSAIAQICRVRTFRSPVEVDTGRVRREINGSLLAVHGSLHCVNVEAVNDSFHPTFCAASRAYAYLIDIENEVVVTDESRLIGTRSCDGVRRRLSAHHLPLLNAMLQRIEGIELNYFALSYGKVKTVSTLCTLYHARASLVEVTTTEDSNDKSRGPKQLAVCVELVGNRFLRRMVRILVATAVREVLRVSRDTETLNIDENCADSAKLLSIICDQKREPSAKAAPPNGLIFVGAEFEGIHSL